MLKTTNQSKANKKTIISTGFFVQSRRFAYEIRGRNPMASQLASREIGGANRNGLPPGQKKSKIPIRTTRLSSNSDGKLSSEGATATKKHLSRNSVGKLGNKPPSRIPIKTECKKTSGRKKELGKNTKPVEGQKSSGKDSGILIFFPSGIR